MRRGAGGMNCFISLPIPSPKLILCEEERNGEGQIGNERERWKEGEREINDER